MCPDGSTGIGPVDMKGRIILQRPTSSAKCRYSGPRPILLSRQSCSAVARPGTYFAYWDIWPKNLTATLTDIIYCQY